MKLRGLFPNSYIHISVSDLNNHTIDLLFLLCKIGRLMWDSINRCSKIGELIV
jgi:hypothetical protein